MTKYNTGNPVGSADPRDLYDNAQVFDEQVNNISSPTVNDRFGRARVTLANQLGYNFKGDYSAGITLNNYNDYIRYDGEFYGPSASATLPYTTTATLPDADSNLVGRGDAVLRQDLASSPSGGNAGSLLVNGVTHAVSSRTAMKAYDVPPGTQFSLEEGGRSGKFVVKSGTPPSDPQEGIFVALTNSNYAQRIWEGAAYVDWFGADPANSDNTAAYDGAISVLPDGTLIRWAQPAKTYIGDFLATDKSFKIDLNKARLRPFSSSAIRLDCSSATYSVNESELLAGANQFTLAGVVSVAAGSLIVLWDGATRASGGDVNLETVEVFSTTNDGANTTVTIVGTLDAHKGANAITATHYPNPLQSPSIANGDYFNEDADITAPAFYILGAKSPAMKSLTAVGNIGHAFRMQNCLDTTHYDLFADKPQSTGSGNGYGATTVNCRNATFKKIKGDSTRHAVDMSNTYGKNSVETVREENALSSPVVIAHNGFGSGATVSDVKYKLATGGFYGVSASSQGYNDALRVNHPVRNIAVNDVEAIIKGAADSIDHVPVYFQNDGDVCSVSKVRMRYSDETQPTRIDSGSVPVRIAGSYKRLDVSDVNANVCGRPLSVSALGPYVGSLCLNGLSFKKSGAPCLITGYDIDVDKVSYGEINTANFVFDIRIEGSNIQRYARLCGILPASNSITKVAQARNLDVVALDGYVEPMGLLLSDAFAIADGEAIPASELFPRSKFFRIDSGVGTGTINVTMPDPIIEGGQEVRMTVISGRNTISVAASANSESFTIADNEVASIVTVGGLWKKVASN